MIVEGVILAVGAAQAGPWTKAKGEVYAKLAADFYVPTHDLDPITGKETTLRYFGQSYALYAEAGLGRGVGASLLLPFSIGTNTFEDGRVLGGGQGRATTARPGDARAAVQAEVVRGVAAALEAKIPMYAVPEIGSAHGAYASLFPLPGDGQVDLTAWVYAGASLPARAWVEGGAGYRHRTDWFVGWEPEGRYVDGVPFHAQVGIALGPAWIAAGADGIVNVEDDAYTRQGMSTSLAAAVRAWRGFSVEARGSYEPWTEHAAQGYGFGGALSWSGSVLRSTSSGSPPPR